MIREQVLGIVAMEPMGEYDATVKYEKLNIVTYNGSTYSALKDTLGNEPTNDEYWQLIAKKGDKGDTYELTDEDKENIKNDITENANSGFNKNVEEKTTAFDNHVMEKTSSFDTNSLNKTNEFNANATSKLEEYNTNANTRLNEYNANADGLMTIAVDTRNELERVKNDVLETGEASDIFVHLKDSTMAEYQELEVEGVCEQVVTSGKNKLGFRDSEVITLNGITASVKDGIISLNGQNANNYLADLLKSINVDLSTNVDETYTLSYIVVSGTKDVKLGVSFRDVNNVQLDYIQDPTNDSLATKKTLSADTLNNTSYLYLFVRTQEVLNNLKIKIQLEKGENSTSYEPYTGGKPSPSPEYPQEISVIENELKVVSCAKSLFDGELIQGSFNGPGNNARCFNKNNIFLEKGEYILLSDLDIEKYKFGILLSTNQFPTNDTNWLLDSGWLQLNEYTFKVETECYFGINIASLNGTDLINPSMFESNKFILVNTNLLTQINANLGNEFVGKINDNAKDTLRVSYNEEDGEYHLYLDKNIGKVVFDGSENWAQNSGNTCFYNNNDTVYLSDEKNKVISTHYESKTFGELYNAIVDYGISLSNSSHRIVIRNKDVSTIEELKSWLSENKPEIVYALAIPYTVDLGVIDMPITYDEVTNLFTDSDLIPIINAKYYRNFTETVRNLQINNDTLKNELVSITNRLSALETAQVSVVNESEVVE